MYAAQAGYREELVKYLKLFSCSAFRKLLSNTNNEVVHFKGLILGILLKHLKDRIAKHIFKKIYAVS